MAYSPSEKMSEEEVKKSKKILFSFCLNLIPENWVFLDETQAGIKFAECFVEWKPTLWEIQIQRNIELAWD